MNLKTAARLDEINDYQAGIIKQVPAEVVSVVKGLLRSGVEVHNISLLFPQLTIEQLAAFKSQLKDG